MPAIKLAFRCIKSIFIFLQIFKLFEDFLMFDRCYMLIIVALLKAFKYWWLGFPLPCILKCHKLMGKVTTLKMIKPVWVDMVKHFLLLHKFWE